MKTERILFTLSDNQKHLFNLYDVCRSACKEVVTLLAEMTEDNKLRIDVAKDFIYAAAKKYEDNETARNKIYDKICKDYKLNQDEISRLDINPSNGVVRVLDSSYKEEDMQKKRFKRMWR